MVSRVEFKVTGAREIEAALKELAAQAANRIARSALNKSATVVVKRARELAPQSGDSNDPYATGLLHKPITKRLRRQRRGSSPQTVVIGVERRPCLRSGSELGRYVGCGGSLRTLLPAHLPART